MDSYFIAISLPVSVRTRLASLCFGLPSVHWHDEENFHLGLRYLGPLTSLQLEDIQNCLQDLFFHPFQIALQGITFQKSSKNHRGTIQVQISPNPDLEVLKKEIDSLIKGLNLPKEERPYSPHVTLGHYEKLDPERSADYLHANGDFTSPSFEISECLLLRIHQTPKRTYYEVINRYEA